MAYAALADLADYLGVEDAGLPGDAQRLLDRACEVVDFYSLGRVDSTNEEHLGGVKKAVCAQVQYWIENHEESEFEVPVKSRTVGKTVIGYAGQSNVRLAPRAKDALLLAGLLFHGASIG